MDGVIGNFTIGYLDLLGFKEMVDTQPLEKLSGSYESLIHKIGEHLNQIEYNGKRFALCKRFVFSDSIILLPERHQGIEHWKDCFGLLVYAWKFTQIALSVGFPIRGAIAHGEMYVNEKDNIFLGKALTKAYELEQQQEWVGVSIDQSVFDAHPDLNEDHPLYNCIFFDYPVPLKNAPPSLRKTLNWRWNLVVKKGTRSLFKESKSSSVQLKQYNTLEYAKKIIESGNVYPIGDQSSIDQLFRTSWVGDTEPPFAHGDDL